MAIDKPAFYGSPERGFALARYLHCDLARVHPCPACDAGRVLAGLRRLVVVGHGISTALWLASARSIDAVTWWRSLRFPDVWDIDLHALEARRIEAIA